MNIPTLVCKNEQRRDQIRDRTRNKKKLNGLDYLEISEDQLTLTVYFLGKVPRLEKENIRIDGGRRVTDIRVLAIEIHREEDAEADDCVHIAVDKFGDFSIYRLCLIESYLDKEGQKRFRTLSGIDPRYACLDFSFKIDCPSDLDCKPQTTCPPGKREEPEINYLAKDYASFRQLILDRLALTMPDWKERHVPDVGITLVEILAYVGDHLSYYQDAVATEAYLDTARRRISVRRHVRLVDYHLHEGCNARTWVTFQVSSDDKTLKPVDFYLITNPGFAPSGTVLNHSQLPTTLPKPYLIFEPLVENKDQPIALYKDHNEIQIYTWGDTQCCLPKGTMSVTIIDPGTPKSSESQHPVECGAQSEPHSHHSEQPATSPQDLGYLLKLQPCDIIIFEEIKGPRTGDKADADPSHRHAVRLIRVEPSRDPLNDQLIWEIEWAVEDALPFSLCISSIKQEDCSLISDVSVIRGNVLLVDHGETTKNVCLGTVPVETIQTDCGDGCGPRETIKIAGWFNPELPDPDVTFSEPLLLCEPRIQSCALVHKLTPASALLKQDVRQALPAVKLHENESTADGFAWEPRLDLLSSRLEDRHFVIEMEEDRRAWIRFGNGELGRFPSAEMQLKAEYRMGNGTVGNVGADSITHLVLRDQRLSGVTITPRNPLPAVGGTNPESIVEAKLFAPNAFRKELQRAITADDYAQIVMRDFGHKVQRAAAKLQWTGSWYEVLVAIDPFGSEDTNEELLCAIKQHLYRYRRIGYDVVVQQASYVALDLAMTICVSPHYLRGHVQSALLDVFSNGIQRAGGKGFFHSDNLSFGEGIYLSKLVAAAQRVEGVESVVVSRLERFFIGPNQEIENGILPLGSFEVARLDNDPSFPENGKLTLDMGGGR